MITLRQFDTYIAPVLILIVSLMGAVCYEHNSVGDYFLCQYVAESLLFYLAYRYNRNLLCKIMLVWSVGKVADELDHIVGYGLREFILHMLTIVWCSYELVKYLWKHR